MDDNAFLSTEAKFKTTVAPCLWNLRVEQFPWKSAKAKPNKHWNNSKIQGIDFYVPWGLQCKDCFPLCHLGSRWSTVSSRWIKISWWHPFLVIHWLIFGQFEDSLVHNLPRGKPLALPSLLIPKTWLIFGQEWKGRVIKLALLTFVTFRLQCG